MLWLVSRKSPGTMKSLLRRTAVANLPAGYPVDIHFNPSYDPYDQRLCLDADGDLFGAISPVGSRSSPITSSASTRPASHQRSGGHIEADIVVTATGLQLQALGGVTISLDGTEIKPQDRFIYKAHMLDEVPNLAWCVGCTNALVDAARRHHGRQGGKAAVPMTSHGYTHAYPHLSGKPQAEKLAWDIKPATSRGHRMRCRSLAPSGRGTCGRTTSPTPSTTASTASVSRWSSAAPPNGHRSRRSGSLHLDHRSSRRRLGSATG